MLIRLKLALLQQGVRQTRMAVDLGWDPSKLSRIMNEIAVPKEDERRAIADYLGVPEAEVFLREALSATRLRKVNPP